MAARMPVVVVLVGCLMVVVGCDRGSEPVGRPSSAVSSASSTLATPGSPPASSTPSTQADVGAALSAAMSDHRYVRVARIATMIFTGSKSRTLNPRNIGRVRLRCDRPTETRAEIRERFSFGQFPVDHPKSRKPPVVVIGTTAYAPDAGIGTGRWLKLPLGYDYAYTDGETSLDGDLAVAACAHPVMLFTYGKNVTRIGTERVGGVATTKYEGILPLNRAAANSTDMAAAYYRWLLRHHLTAMRLTVWLDANYLPLRYEFRQAGAVEGEGVLEEQVTLSDWGTGGTIRTTPPDQIDDRFWRDEDESERTPGAIAPAAR